MVIGNMFSGSNEQYVANLDDKGTWRIIDTHHQDLKMMTSDDDVPDESPAIKVLKQGEYLALIREAGGQGLLEGSSFNSEIDTTELEYEIELKDKKIKELEEELNNLTKEKRVVEKAASHSEEFELKEKAMDNIIKLVSMQDMTKLTRD